MPQIRSSNLLKIHDDLTQISLDFLDGIQIQNYAASSYPPYLMSFGISHALACQRTKEYLSHIIDLKYHLVRRSVEGNKNIDQWLRDVQVMFLMHPHPDSICWRKFIGLSSKHLKNVYQFYEWSPWPILLQIAAESFKHPKLQKQAHEISKFNPEIPFCFTNSRMRKSSLGRVIANNVNYADVSNGCVWYSRSEQIFVESGMMTSVYTFEHKIVFVSASTESKSALIGTTNQDYYVVTLRSGTIGVQLEFTAPEPIEQVVYLNKYWAWTYSGVLAGAVDILHEKNLVQKRIGHPWIGDPQKVRIEPNKSLVEYQSSKTGNVIWSSTDSQPLIKMPSMATSWFSATLVNGIWIHSANRSIQTTLIQNMGFDVSNVKHIVVHNNVPVVLGFTDGTWAMRSVDKQHIRFQATVHNVHCAAIDNNLNQLHLWGDSTSTRTRTELTRVNGRFKYITKTTKKKQFRWAIYDLMTGRRLFLRVSKQVSNFKEYQLRVHEDQLLRIGWNGSVDNPSRRGTMLGWTLQPKITKQTYPFQISPYSDVETAFAVHQFNTSEGFSPYRKSPLNKYPTLAPKNGFVRFVNSRLIAGTPPSLHTILTQGTKWRGNSVGIVSDARKIGIRRHHSSWQQHRQWQIDAEIANLMVFETNLIVTTWSGDIFSLDSNGSTRRIHMFPYDLVSPPQILSRVNNTIHVLQYPKGYSSQLIELDVDTPGEIVNVKAVTNLAYLPKMNLLVSVDFNGTVQVWDVSTRKIKFLLNDGRSQLGKLVLDKTETILATGCTGWCGHNPCRGCDHYGWLLWDLNTGQKLDPHGRIFEISPDIYLLRINDWMQEKGFECIHEIYPVQSTHQTFHKFQDNIWCSTSSISVVCKISDCLYAFGDQLGNVYFVDVY